MVFEVEGEGGGIEWREGKGGGGKMRVKNGVKGDGEVV